MSNDYQIDTLAPEDRRKTDIILSVVAAFEEARTPVPKNFICGQRGWDGRISAFTLNVQDLTETGTRRTEWKGDLEPGEMPGDIEKEKIMAEIRNQEKKSAAPYPGHCVPRNTTHSPAR